MVPSLEERFKKLKVQIQKELEEKFSIRDFIKKPIKLEELFNLPVLRDLYWQDPQLMTAILNEEKKNGVFSTFLQEQGETNKGVLGFKIDINGFKDVCSVLLGRILEEKDFDCAISGEKVTDQDVPVIFVVVKENIFGKKADLCLASKNAVLSELLVYNHVTLNGRAQNVYERRNEYILEQLKDTPEYIMIDEAINSAERWKKNLTSQLSKPIPKRAIQILKDFGRKFNETDYMHTSNVSVDKDNQHLSATQAGDILTDALAKLAHEEPELHQQLMALPMYSELKYESTFGEALKKALVDGGCGANFQLQVRRMLYELGVEDKNLYTEDLKSPLRATRWEKKNQLNVISDEAYIQHIDGLKDKSKQKKDAKENAEKFLQSGTGEFIEKLRKIDKRSQSGNELDDEELKKLNKNVKKSEKLNQYILPVGVNAHLLLQDVAGDGNCFYHAMSHQLARQNPPRLLDADALRALAINEIATHTGLYESFTGDLDRFILTNANSGVWADHVMIFALANALGTNVNIHRADGTVTPVPASGAGLTVNVFYTGNHYMSVLQNSNINQPAPNQLEIGKEYERMMEKGMSLSVMSRKDHEINFDDIKKLAVLLDEKDLIADIRERRARVLEKLERLVGKDKVEKMRGVVVDNDIKENEAAKNRKESLVALAKNKSNTGNTSNNKGDNKGNNDENDKGGPSSVLRRFFKR